MPIIGRDMKRGGDGWRGRRAARELAGTLAALAFLAVNRPVAADGDAGVRQVYERGPGAESCPDAAALRARVAELAGADLFDDSGEHELFCSVTRKDDHWVAVIELRRTDAEVLRPRVITSSDCDELIDNAGLVIAMVLARSPEWPRGEAGATAPESSAATPAVAVLQAAPPITLAGRAPAPIRVSSRARSRIRLMAHALGSASLHTSSDLGASLGAGAGVRMGARSLAIEVALDTARTVTLENGGEISTATGSVSLVPCAHRRSLSGCGLLSAGWIRGRGHAMPETHSATTPHFRAGARLAWERPLALGIGLRVFLDLTGSLSRTTILVDDAPVWETPWGSASLGLAAVCCFRDRSASAGAIPR